MKILVTGGSGFIGSHIVEELILQNHEVTVLDDLRAGVNFTPKGAKLLKKALDTIPDLEGIEAVVHAAARADVASNWKDFSERWELYKSNIEGTVELLEAAGDVPFVFLSTCAVYGDCADGREDTAVLATSPYAASKLAGEALVQAYAHANGKPWHVFRLGCVVGSRYHHGHIADFVGQGRKGAIAPKNNGATAKSFVHVLDVAQAVAMAVREELPRGVYNVASGTWAPRDTIREMRADAITTWPLNTHGWIGDPMAVVNNGKLKSAGWLARHGIATGVRDALEYLKWGR